MGTKKSRAQQAAEDAVAIEADPAAELPELEPMPPAEEWVPSADVAREPGVLGLSSDGPFIEPFVTDPAEQERLDQEATVKRFEAFREDLYKLLYRHSFLPTSGLAVSDIKGERSRLKRARILGSAVDKLELVK